MQQELCTYEEYLALTRAEDRMKRERFTVAREPLERWRKRSDGGWELEVPPDPEEELYGYVLASAF